MSFYVIQAYVKVILKNNICVFVMDMQTHFAAIF